MFKKTLSGRTECGYEGETNDCGVRALAEAANITYAESHSFWSKLGRQNKNGVYFKWLDSFLESNDGYCFGKQVTETIFPFHKHETHKWDDNKQEYIRHTKRMNVKTFIQQNPTGRFIVLSRGHAKAVVDGVIHDQDDGIYSEIQRVYKFS
jgi:hypothetical protein